LTTPTAEEIEGAHKLVEEEGPQSQTTRELSELAVRNPHLAAFIDQMYASIGPAFDGNTGVKESQIIVRSVLTATLVGGLGLGVRIGEAREIPIEEEPEV
jgi:hypothetical protein